MAKLTIANDEAHLADLAAERLTRLIEVTIDGRGHAPVCLSGGSTPHRLYTRLADPARPWRDLIDWSHVHLFWSDERHVPPDHPDSNYGMAKAALIDHVPIPGDHVHRVRGELPDAGEAADDYEHTLDTVASAFRRKADVESGFSRIPSFDLMLLGLGEDAHIASIFPGSELLGVGHPSDVGHPFTGCRVAAVWAPHLSGWRITLTPNAILDSRAIVVLVAGANKAAAVRAALEEPLDVARYPAQLLRTAGDHVEWFVDRAAASRL
jgi:6-phosphogluconolactonase